MVEGREVAQPDRHALPLSAPSPSAVEWNGRFTIPIPLLFASGEVALQGSWGLAVPFPTNPLTALAVWANRRHAWLAAGVAALISLLSLLYFYQAGLLTALSDSRSRLLLARHVVDGIDVGPSQLGAVWLPLPQVLMTPLVWNDFLYQSGLAGAAVSMASFLLACIFIYKLLVRLTGSRLAGAAGIIFFANPNVLFLQSTAMSEMPFLALWLGTVYFFALWAENPHHLRDLLLTALFLILATLTRYEGWVLLLATCAAIAWTLRQHRFTYAKAEGYMSVFVTLAFAGVALWLLWNAVIFGSPFYFAQSQYSATVQGTSLNAGLAVGQRTAGNFLLSLAIYSVTAIESMGWVAALVAACGLAYWLFPKPLASSKLAIAGLLLFPFPFYVASLWSHSVTIQNPYFTPGVYLNASYGLLMVPAAAFFAGYLAARWRSAGRLLVPTLGVASALLLLASGPLDIAEAQGSQADPGVRNQMAAGDWLHTHYTGGLVLRQRFGNEASSFDSQIPLASVVYEGDQYRWQSALQDPAGQHVEWIFMRGTVGANGQSDEVWQKLHATPQLLDNYYLAYQQGGIEVYVRNPSPGGSS